MYFNRAAANGHTRPVFFSDDDQCPIFAKFIIKISIQYLTNGQVMKFAKSKTHRQQAAETTNSRVPRIDASATVVTLAQWHGALAWVFKGRFHRVTWDTEGGFQPWGWTHVYRCSPNLEEIAKSLWDTWSHHSDALGKMCRYPANHF